VAADRPLRSDALGVVRAHRRRWREALVFVPPATVLAWQRRRFREHWARLSWKQMGRPSVSQDLRARSGTSRLPIEAFPWETVPRYLRQDRDAVYGQMFARRVADVGLAQVLTAPRSSWQNPYAERVIGSIRRECLDQVIVFGEDHCRHVLTRYVAYYHRWRTRLALAMDAPDRRPVQSPERDAVVTIPEVGRLHHHYERRAA
jgi:hypothetical protein